ncbi:MAG: glycosyltransferase [Flammeovirgaceae bacterium]|nr:glycosyltransferase [Flammeovirgaceae bacterium]
MKGKNIMLIIPELSLGGAAKSMANLSRLLAKQHNIWVVIFNREARIDYNISGEIIDLGVRSGKRFINKGLAFINRVVRLKRLKRKLNIDVSISF